MSESPASINFLWPFLSITCINVVALALLPVTLLRIHPIAIEFLLCLSVGTLLGDAFMHLIATSDVSIGALIGIYSFYLLERLIQQYHKGHGHAHVLSSLLIVADGLHNLLDGIAIGVSFIASPIKGMSTSFAILCHEIPHELSDYAIMMSADMTTLQILKIALLFSAFSYIGVGIGCLVGVELSNGPLMPYILAFVGGNFIYIALADLLPEIQRLTGGRSGHHHSTEHIEEEEESASETTELVHSHGKLEVGSFVVRHLGLLLGFAIMYGIRYLE